MKICKLVVLSLTLVSAHAMAFKARIPAAQTLSTQQLRTAEDGILSNEYSQHATSPQSTILGTCSAAPVPGCQCPLCSIIGGNHT